MNLTLRVGRFTITLLDIEIDDDVAPPMSTVSDNERDPVGFVPPDWYADEEDRG